VQQAPDQGAGVEIDEFLLPDGEFDLSLVLLARAVLREQARPVLGVGADLRAATFWTRLTLLGNTSAIAAWQSRISSG
jgi:hypothetical protein